MEIHYFRGLWGMTLPTLEMNLAKIKAGGFDGVEMKLPEGAAAQQAARALLDELGLELILQIHTLGRNAEEHAHSLEELYRSSLSMRPLFINSHTGKDYFSTQQNLVVFRRALELEREMGAGVVHEIHRGRATFSTLAAMSLIEALPEIQFTADFSHWCCVHESLLEDQDERVERAIAHSRHIHARVGYAEGPQVNDPHAPEWQPALERHLGWWQRIVDHSRQSGLAMLTICPEFGPPDYMPTLPYTRQPVSDLWEVNLYMKELLRQRLKV